MDQAPTPPAVLDGWKQIADHLGKSVRTVQRWERELHLPVHRAGAGSSYSVYAEPVEIDRWLARNREAAATPETPLSPNEPTFEPDTPSSQDVPISESDDPPREFTWVTRLSVSAGLATVGILGALLLGGWPGTAAPSAVPVASAPVNHRGEPMVLTVGDTILVVDSAGTLAPTTISRPAEAPYNAYGAGTVTPDGRTLVLTTDSSGVIMFDMRERRFGRWLGFGTTAVIRAALSAGGRSLLVADRYGRVLTVDPDSGRESGRVSLPREIFDVVPNRADTGFFVSSRDAGWVTYVNASTLAVVTRLETGRGAHDIATTSNGALGFVTNEYANTVSCLDLDDRQILGTASVGSHPIRLVVASDDRTVYVANRDDGSVSVLDGTRCAVRQTIPRAAEGDRVWAVSVTADGQRLFVAGFQRNVYVRDLSRPGAPLVDTINTLTSVQTIVRSPLPVQTARRNE